MGDNNNNTCSCCCPCPCSPHHPTRPHSSTRPRTSTRPSSPSTCPRGAPTTCQCTCFAPPPPPPVSYPTRWPPAILLPSSLHHVPSFHFPTLPSSCSCSLAFNCPDFNDCPNSSQRRICPVAQEHQPASQPACGKKRS